MTRIYRVAIIIEIVVLLIITILSINIAKEAKNIETINQKIIYSYDCKNKVSEDLTSAHLIIERINADKVEIDNSIYNVLFNDTYFGTLEIIFPEPLQREQVLHLTLSEASKDDSAWTRKDMNSNLNGFGVSYYSNEVTIPEGTTSYIVELPDRPLPMVSAINGEWKGGTLPFCCCTIQGYNGAELKEENFVQLAVHCNFNDKASYFVSSDELLNEVYSFCKKTIKSTTYAGVYIDGYRELRPYEADAYINELGHFSIDDNYEIARETIRYLVNHHTWPTEWILQTVPLMYQYYMYSGDISFIRENYPELQDSLLLNIENEDGLIDSALITEELLDIYGISDIKDIVDWPVDERDGFSHENRLSFRQWKRGVGYRYKSFIAMISGCPYASTLYRITGDAALKGDITISSPNAVVNAFYYQSLEQMSELADAIGNSEDAEFYQHKAERLKRVFQDSFINTETDLIIDAIGSNHSSLHANMFALDFGLVPAENEIAVIDFIKSKGMACSVYGSQYLLEALIKHGRTDYALSLITSRDTNSWYNMVYRTGSKLTTEAWDESIKPDMDWNHAWGTAPINIVTRYVVGVRPDTPGCETIVFEPMFGAIEECDATIPFNNGAIDISYRNSDNNVEMTFDSTAQVRLIISDEYEDITIDDVLANTEINVVLNSGKHTVSYTVK